MSDQKGQFARPVYLLGAGKSPFGVLCQNTTSPLGVETDSGADSPLKDMSERELTATACYNAYEDAGIRARDVEKVVFGNVANFHLGEGIAGSAQFLSWMGCQGKPMTHHEEACATGYVVLGDAIEAVASGQYDIVLAVCYDSAASFYHRYELPYMQHPRNEFTFGDGRFEALWQGNDPAFERWMGASEISPFDMGGYIYMEDYGKTPDEIDDYLNAIAYNERYNAVRNEDAFYHEDFDQIAKKAGFSSGMEYLKSDQNMRISPFSRRLHNLTHLDGAAAVVVCSEKVAKASGKLPIKVLASAFSTVPQYVHRNYQVMNKNVVKALYPMAGVTPDEIDYMQCCDMGCSEVLFSVEDFGYLPAGEGWKYHMDGRTRFDGDKPINANGGSMSNGHPFSAAGLSATTECIRQMRDEAGAHEITKGAPRTVLMRGMGGAHTTAGFIFQADDE